MKNKLFLIFPLFFMVFTHHIAFADSTLEILGKIPVQNGGRIKPFDSFARESILSVTGKRKVERQEPTLTVWMWMASPATWRNKAFLPAAFNDLEKELGSVVVNGKISPQAVLDNFELRKEAENAMMRQEKKQKLSQLDQKRVELFSRARLFEAISQKGLPGMIADPEEVEQGWLPLEALTDEHGKTVLSSLYAPEVLTPLFSNYQTLMSTISSQTISEWKKPAHNFSSSLDKLLESRGVKADTFKINLEYFYNHAHFFRWAWMFYLTGVILAAFQSKRKQWSLGLTFISVAFVFHTIGFVIRCWIAGRPPVSNMYESVIWVSWAAVTFSGILFAFYRNSIALRIAALVATAGLLVGDGLPAVLDSSLSPLVPVLKSNYWLTIHVLTITLSYGAFALAWGISHVILYYFAFRRSEQTRLKELSLLLQRTLQIGVVLLAAGTILGGVWANYSWGRFWGWDPKETWALIALLGYLALLHGRYVGWWSAFGTAVGSLLAFFGVVMAWYGVNFVLAAGLHSYGFGTGGFPYVLTIVGVDMATLVFLVSKAKKLI